MTTDREATRAIIFDILDKLNEMNRAGLIHWADYSELYDLVSELQ